MTSLKEVWITADNLSSYRDTSADSSILQGALSMKGELQSPSLATATVLLSYCLPQTPGHRIYAYIWGGEIKNKVESCLHVIVDFPRS